MIAGFIITGSATKDVVVRGIGPSLMQLGVPNAINDPTVRLINSNGVQLSFNDNYESNSQSDLSVLEASGLAPGAARESAILATLLPGAYIAILAGKTNGVGLVEVYDFNRGASSLMNISTRGKVEMSDNVNRAEIAHTVIHAGRVFILRQPHE